MSSASATPNTYPYRNESHWSKSEKTIARKIFDVALKRELQEVMQEAKRMANQIKETPDLWDLEHYLTERRKEINRKYDYRIRSSRTYLGDYCTSAESQSKSYAVCVLTN